MEQHELLRRAGEVVLCLKDAVEREHGLAPVADGRLRQVIDIMPLRRDTRHSYL